MSNENRRPKGIPSGGQFGPSSRTEADVALRADLKKRFAGDDPAYECSTTNAPRSRIGPTCPDCNTIHGADAAVAEGRFGEDGPRGYRSRLGGPLRDTRKEAHGDYCGAQAAMLNSATQACPRCGAARGNCGHLDADTVASWSAPNGIPVAKVSLYGDVERIDDRGPAAAQDERREPVCNECGRTISDTPAREECEDWHTPGVWDPEEDQ
jgi:hypothetical protein